MDDIALFLNSDQAIEKVIGYFSEACKVRVDKKNQKFLEFTVNDSGLRIHIHNKPMVDRLLDYFGMKQCIPPKHHYRVA